MDVILSKTRTPKTTKNEGNGFIGLSADKVKLSTHIGKRLLIFWGHGPIAVPHQKCIPIPTNWQFVSTDGDTQQNKINNIWNHGYNYQANPHRNQSLKKFVNAMLL